MFLDARKATCVGTGFIVLDVIQNTMSGIASEKRLAGGSCGNILAILAYFGWQANAVGRIGDDDAGQELLFDLNKWGVQTKWIQIEAGYRTPIVVQQNYRDSKGRPRHRFLHTYPDSSSRLCAYRPIQASVAKALSTQLPPHSVFFFDRVAPGTLELAKKSRANGALVVFEPSGIKNEAMFIECLRTAHIIKYSIERIKNIHHYVEKYGVPIEIETSGVRGLRIRTMNTGRFNTWTNLPAISSSSFIDAAGSGDWCTAGFLQYIHLHSLSIDLLTSDTDTLVNAIRFGQALATLNCGFEGARGLMYAATAQRVTDRAVFITSETIHGV